MLAEACVQEAPEREAVAISYARSERIASKMCGAPLRFETERGGNVELEVDRDEGTSDESVRR